MDGYEAREATLISIRRYDETICSSRVIFAKVCTKDEEVVDLEWAREAGRKPVEAFDMLWNLDSGAKVVLYESSVSSNLSYAIPAAM